MSGCRLEWLESRKCLAGLRDVCAPMGVSAGLLEEVSCETLVFETWRVTFGGSLVRNARLAASQRDFWRKSRTKRSFWRKSRTKRSFLRLDA